MAVLNHISTPEGVWPPALILRSAGSEYVGFSSKNDLISPNGSGGRHPCEIGRKIHAANINLTALHDGIRKQVRLDF